LKQTISSALQLTVS